MKQHNQPNWLIVGGCPRSGTTLLNFILNENPNIFLANEQNLYKTVCLSNQLFYREDHLKNRKERKLSKREEIIAMPTIDEKLKHTILKSKSQQDVITCLFISSLVGFDFPNSSIWYIGDKYPRYYDWDYNYLKKVIGNFKVIHITRSPIMTVNSMRFRSINSKKGLDWWRHYSVIEAAGEWIKAWNFVNTIKDVDKLHIKYEDLCLYPNLVTDQILDFLGTEGKMSANRIKIIDQSIDSLTSKDISTLIKIFPSDLIDWKLSINELSAKYAHISIPKKSIMSLQKLYNFINRVFNNY